MNLGKRIDMVYYIKYQKKRKLIEYFLFFFKAEFYTRFYIGNIGRPLKATLVMIAPVTP